MGTRWDRRKSADSFAQSQRLCLFALHSICAVDLDVHCAKAAGFGNCQRGGGSFFKHQSVTDRWIFVGSARIQERSSGRCAIFCSALYLLLSCKTWQGDERSTGAVPWPHHPHPWGGAFILLVPWLRGSEAHQATLIGDRVQKKMGALEETLEKNFRRSDNSQP